MTTGSRDKVVWADRTLIQNPFYMGVCKSEKAFHAAQKKLGIPTTPWIPSTHAHATVHYFKSKDKLVVLVCVKPKRGRAVVELHGLLVHEATHIWQWIKEEIGEPTPSTEFEAYAIQGIAQRLMEAHDKTTPL